jgi:hypothetical protein
LVNEILEFLLDFGLYSLWMFTFALTLTSSIILLNYYINSKGTPLGRTAFYFFLNSFWWSVASAWITIPIITTMGFVRSYFYLFFPFMAGIASILGTYQRARIQSFLQPGTKKQTPDTNLLVIISFCIFGVSLIVIIGALLNNPILNIVVTGTGGLTSLGFMLISGLLIAFALERARKLVYIGSLSVLILGLTVMIGHALEIVELYSPLPGDPTKVSTALVFVIAGFWTATAKEPGLKWWIVKMVMAFTILSSIILAFITHLTYHTQDLTTLTTFLIVLVGGTLLRRSWKMQRL